MVKITGTITVLRRPRASAYTSTEIGKLTKAARTGDMAFREVTPNTETAGAYCEQNTSSFVDSINKTLCSFNCTAISHVISVCEQDLNELRDGLYTNFHLVVKISCLS